MCLDSAAFLRAMKTIHKAGVRHRDIRPYNLLVNDANEVTIVDFDRAVLDARTDVKRAEYNMLKKLLDGNYIPPHHVRSDLSVSDDNPSSDSAPNTAPPAPNVLTE
jgi:serine/threonine protein kinase